MIAYIQGKLVEKDPTKIVIEANGIGYDIHVPISSYETLGSEGQIVKVFIHFHVRDDNYQLYGFSTEEERDLFRMLIGVQGIGPKVGIALLSGLKTDNLRMAVAAEDSKTLASVPGIGKKTAERLVVELKEKFKDYTFALIDDSVKEIDQKQVMFRDAILALISLGYNRTSADKAVRDSYRKQESLTETEELVRLALQRISK
ncbi:MAG: Holliday junction branch migration protein RuvA [Candidatus Theseobacter exili]|nr:Holliday junction branch migration protein RuvA [Candidatus Theseobacter exili]